MESKRRMFCFNRVEMNVLVQWVGACTEEIAKFLWVERAKLALIVAREAIQCQSKMGGQREFQMPG